MGGIALGSWTIVAWRVAETLEVLRREFNAAYPSRDKSSDGSIGDAAHASRNSDHNPWVKYGGVGVVTARDFDEDLGPGGGALMEAIVQRILAGAKAGRLPQVKYVIYERRIWNRKYGFAKRAYNGINAHSKHAHISVESSKALFDRTTAWNVVKPGSAPAKAAAKPAAKPATAARPELKAGSKGEAVKKVQKATGTVVDGDYGPNTVAAVKAFQKKHGLPADGIVGPLTWAKIA